MSSSYPYQPSPAPRPPRGLRGRRVAGGPGGLGGQSGRRRKRWYFIAIAVVLAATAVVAAVRITCGVVDNAKTSGAFQGGAARNALWAGPPTTPYSEKVKQANAEFPGWVVMPKFVDNYDITQQLADASDMVAAAPNAGSAPKVVAYFNTSYWFTANDASWGQYAEGFKKSWYLHDTDGNPIPFWGAGSSADDATEPAGYVVDLTNSAYRAWVVSTIEKWAQAAPLGGVAFDAATPMIGSFRQRAPIADGDSTWNQLLCGHDQSGTETGNCQRVDEWNTGMASLFSEARTVLNPLGLKVIYNGVAPSDFRGPDRNVGLLDSADGASNESFCLFATAHQKDKLEFMPIQSDLDMMAKAAQDRKILFEITNYQADNKTQYSDYCQGAFMLGWEPGSSYWIYHQNYSDDAPFPKAPEQALDLGNPTGTYTKTGDLYLRQFEHGWVVVNPTDSDANVTLPDVALTSFKGGKQAEEYTAGQKVGVGGHDALLLLDNSTFTTTLSAPRQVCQAF